MIILPAIDVKNSQVVRLSQGDYNKVEIYSENPLEIALNFQKLGATNLHMVDLDGAKDGTLSNFSTINEIVKNTALAVEVGGGIRDAARIEKYLDAGVARVILGTVAARDPEFVKEMVTLFGDKIAVGIDAKDEKVAVEGWTELTAVNSIDFCLKMESYGVSTIIYTDISKDGMMSGTNMEVYRVLQQKLSCNVIASGGIISVKEVEELARLGLYGAIIGKAIYTGDIDLREVLAYEQR